MVGALMNNCAAITMGTMRRGAGVQCGADRPGPQCAHLKALGGIDPILFSRSRLSILAYLCAVPEATFTELRTAVGATDGNVFIHLKKLRTRGYVRKHQCKPHGRETKIHLTQLGRNALHRFRMALLEIDVSTACGSSDHE